MKSYSQDMRDRVIEWKLAGISVAESAKRLGVSRSFAARCWSRYANTGDKSARRRGGYRICILEAHRKKIVSWIKSDGNITLESLSERCKDEFGITMTLVGLWKFLDKIGQSFKKNATRQRARQGRRTPKA